MENQQDTSLVVKFDEICDNFEKMLNKNSDSEFLKFSINQEECRRKWQEAEIECNHLRDLLRDSNRTNMELESRIRHISTLLMHEVKTRQKFQQENNHMMKQLSLVKEIVSSNNNTGPKNWERLANIGSNENLTSCPKVDNHPSMQLMLSDVLNQRTEDELELSASADIRSIRSTYTFRRIPVISSPDEEINHQKSICGNGEHPPETVVNPALPRVGRNLNKPPRPPPPPLSSCPSAESLNQQLVASDSWLHNGRQHNFAKKTIIKPETCLPCGNRVKFGRTALKCNDCRLTCHQDCKPLMPLPCIPFVVTPTSIDLDGVGKIGDYSPSVTPMIPALVVHCVNQIEQRGKTVVGLYSVDGSERNIKDIKECLLRNTWHPLMLNTDVHLIAGTVKSFLAGLKEPMIPLAMRDRFLTLGSMKDECDVHSAVYSLVPQLPQPNRDTLAFLILHLQRVARSVECKMPASRLAEIFGPIILGRSDQTYSLRADEDSVNVFRKLLEISRNYWTRFVDVDTGKARLKGNHHSSTFFSPPSLR